MLSAVENRPQHRLFKIRMSGNCYIFLINPKQRISFFPLHVFPSLKFNIIFSWFLSMSSSGSSISSSIYMHITAVSKQNLTLKCSATCKRDVAAEGSKSTFRVSFSSKAVSSLDCNSCELK
uniref:Uncharacterized protein n=1 Tax=Parascaris equorum TaxID=6256 RepID=A0A914R7Q3_PAREQ